LLEAREGQASPRRFGALFEMCDDFHSDDLTGLVLAGGASRRMGQDKAFLELGGRPLIQIVVERMTEVCDEVIIVADDVASYAGVGVAVVPDRFQDVGVLGGLHAGLAAASHELTLAVGCDMPFLKPALLRAFAAWADGYDVALLRHNGHVEPLHGAYRRTCLRPIEAAIRAGRRRIVSFFPHVCVRTISPEEVRPLDPGLNSFRNVNTPLEWEAAKEEWPET
jgi:molybdopterin-guanine dinucleotide biosynthesis protein A